MLQEGKSLAVSPSLRTRGCAGNEAAHGSGENSGAVVEVDEADGEGFGGEELEADGAMAWLNQGDAFADEEGKRGREQ